MVSQLYLDTVRVYCVYCLEKGLLMTTYLYNIQGCVNIIFSVELLKCMSIIKKVIKNSIFLYFQVVLGCKVK